MWFIEARTRKLSQTHVALVDVLQFAGGVRAQNLLQPSVRSHHCAARCGPAHVALSQALAQGPT